MIPKLIQRQVFDSAAWTGRYPKPPKPQSAPEPPRTTIVDDLARLAAEHGTDFASRVAASYNAARSART